MRDEKPSCSLNCWTDDGRLLVQDYGSGDNPDTLFVLDTETGATAQLTQGYYTNVYDPYIVAYQKPGQASSCILYDINRRSTTVIPVAPQGYTYQMPFFVSPGRTRIAIWLTASNAEQVIGVMDVTTNPASLRMFAPPTRVMGELMWLDDGTVIVQSGAISDPDRATWALKVGDRK